MNEYCTLNITLLVQLSLLMLAHCLIEVCVLLNLCANLSVEGSEGRKVTT